MDTDGHRLGAHVAQDGFREAGTPRGMVKRMLFQTRKDREETGRGWTDAGRTGVTGRFWLQERVLQVLWVRPQSVLPCSQQHPGDAKSGRIVSLGHWVLGARPERGKQQVWKPGRQLPRTWQRGQTPGWTDREDRGGDHWGKRSFSGAGQVGKPRGPFQN